MITARDWVVDTDDEERPRLSSILNGRNLPPRKDASNSTWRTDQSDRIASGTSVALTVTKTHAPWSVSTLLSEDNLHGHGLRVFRHESRSWLVSVDADTLTDERPSASWLSALAERVSELEELGAEEGSPFSRASADDAIAFARELNAARRPGVFLVGNGNIRLLWSDGPEQIGLQFKGDDMIQYVMFARRDERIATHMGDDDQYGILRQITAAGLRHLLNN